MPRNDRTLNMERIKLTLSILLIIIISYGQEISYGQKECSCEALLKTNGIHKVYADTFTNSKVVYELNNDTIKENYFIIIIYQINNNWAEISAYSPNEEIQQKGWIQLFNIGILTSDYPILFDKPNKNSSFIMIKNYDYNYLDIIDCKNNWLKVKYLDKVNIYRGWLPPDNQCANPYTTCN